MTEPQPTPLRTRRTVPVIEPTEWIQFHIEHIVAIAEWLNDRGVRCELSYGGDGQYPSLWRQSSIGRTSVDHGQWLGVRGGMLTVVDADELDKPTYRDIEANGDRR